MTDVVAESLEPAARPRSRPRRVSVPVVLAAIILLVAVICAIAGSWIAPHDPNEQDLFGSLQGPSRAHLLGTDDLGRDILSRTIVGARTAIIGPALIAAGAALIGNLLRRAGRLLAAAPPTRRSRAIVDFIYALPALLVAIVVVGVLGGGYFLAVGLLVVLFAPVDTRIVRARRSRSATARTSRPRACSASRTGGSCTATSGRTCCRSPSRTPS